MVTQLADNSPTPDLRYGKFGLRPTIGPSFFFGRELTVCLQYVEHKSSPNRREGLLGFFCWSSIVFWSSKCGKDFVLLFFLETFFFVFWVLKRILISIYLGPFPKFFNFPAPSEFSSVQYRPLLKLVEYPCYRRCHGHLVHHTSCQSSPYSKYLFESAVRKSIIV